MKKLLVLGSNDNVALVQVVNRAKKLGIYTVVTDWNPVEKSPAKQVSDAYWMISTSDLDALEAKCREEQISGIYGGTDYAVDVALELSERLHIRFYCDRETWKYSRDKAAFKEQCRKYGVPTARQYFLSDEPTEEELNAVQYPVIVKPVDRSGNLGFSYCYNPQELKEGYKKALETSENGIAIIEKLLKGREYTAMYALAEGNARLLNFWAMFSQPAMPENCYSVSTTVTDKMHYYNENVAPQVAKLLKGLGYRDGIVWIEFMADEDGSLNALEIGHRLSGEMLWLALEDVRNFSALDWMIHFTVNGYNDASLLPDNQVDRPQRCACGYILWTKEAGRVSAINGTEEVGQREGFNVSIMARVNRQTDAFRYGVIVTFSADNVNDLFDIICWINQRISLLNENGKDILIHYDDFNAIKLLSDRQD